MWTRRDLLGVLGATAGLAALGLPGPAHAAADAPRLVVVVLRGGLDGLAMLVPHGDPHYARARGGLALDPATVRDLDGTFGLHPALAPIHGWFDEGHLLPLHAVGLPYRERSHFDAQEVLENGTAKPGGARDGWMNRAVLQRPEATAVAIGPRVPLILQGQALVHAVNPRRDRAAHASFLDAVGDLYADDAELSAALASGRESLALLPEEGAQGRGRGLDPRVASVLAGVADRPAAASLVSVDVGGWDTHAGQGTERGGLAARLRALAQGLAALRGALGPAWDHTAVVVVTEFGRTVTGNGTGGSDHGVGGAALLAGGAIRGGRVLADWPGLSRPALLDGRDLRPTTDLRQLFAGLLQDHIGLRPAELARVFPGSAPPPLAGLTRVAHPRRGG